MLSICCEGLPPLHWNERAALGTSGAPPLQLRLRCSKALPTWHANFSNTPDRLCTASPHDQGPDPHAGPTSATARLDKRLC